MCSSRWARPPYIPATTWKPSLLAAVRRALTPTGTLIPNHGRGGRWLGPLGRIVKARVLSGQVTPVIDRTYPLDEAADALRYVGAGHTRGKVVVTVWGRDDENDPTRAHDAQTCRHCGGGPLLSQEEPMTIRTNTPNLLDNPPSE